MHATQGSPDTPTEAHRAGPAARTDVAGSDIEVIQDDPAPLRALRHWRRAGRAEGRRAEWHVGRALALLAALAVLIDRLPGAAAFIGILSFLVLIHEAGHYVVARRCGMRPTEFFVGFGPTIWSHTTRDGLRWGLKAIPAGGYVKIPGMGPREEVEAALEPYTYRAATRPRRLAVILAGVAVNFLFAIAAFATYALLTPGAATGPVDAVATGVSNTVEVTTSTVTGLVDLFGGLDDYTTSIASGDAPDQRMLSLVGGSQLADELLGSAPLKLLLLTAIFSASVGLFNLLPVLPLDGGHALLVMVESVWARLRRRPHLRLDPNRLTPVAVAVVAVLVALSATAMYLDVVHPVALG